MWVVPLSVSVPLRSVSNCLVLLFATTSLTSDRVMSPNGSFSTVLNNFVLEWGQGMVLRWGGGGNSKLCAFLKRGRNSSYLWGLHRRRGGCVFKIWMSRVPERTKKNQHVQFLRHHSNRAVPPPGGGTPYITYTGMCRPKGSWFWSSWFRTGYPFQRRFLERGIIFRTHESSPLL